MENIIEQLFDYQADLMRRLGSRDLIPKYPIDIQSKLGQEIIRSYLEKAHEEMMEAAAELENLNELSFSVASPDPEDLVEVRLAFNTELIDALCFILEVFIFAGLDGSTFSRLASDVLQLSRKEDITTSMFAMAASRNRENYTSDKTTRVIMPGDFDPAIALQFISPYSTLDYSIHLHHYHRAVFKLTSLLKNKPWKQSLREVNGEHFYTNLVEILGQYISLVQYFGMSPEAMLEIYKEKYDINIQRIQENV